MIRVFQIDDSVPGAKAFLEFLKTSDFVKEEDEIQLSQEQTEALEKGLKSLKKTAGPNMRKSWNALKANILTSFVYEHCLVR